MSEPLVVIGNGMAAARLRRGAARRRALGRYAIAVVGEEPRLAYNRVLLSSRAGRRGRAGRGRAASPRAGGATAASRCSTASAATAIDPRDPPRARSRAAPRCPTPSWCSRPARGRSGCRSRAWSLPGVLTFRDLARCRRDRRRGARRAQGRGDRRRPARARSGLRPRARPARSVTRRPPDGPADGAPARSRAPPAMLKRALEAQGHRRPSRRRDRGASAATQRVEARRARRTAAHRRRPRGRRGRHPRQCRPRAHRRPRRQSRHRGRRRPADQHRRHPRDRRMRRASRRLLRPGRAGLRAGARAGATARRRDAAPIRGSVLATNLKVSGVNVFSAGDFLGARRHRADRALRSRASAPTRSSSSPTAGSSARCCSAIPRTASGIST